MADELKTLQMELAQTLRRLHKALLDAEAQHFGPVKDRFELLNLALSHPRFAWLRRLSELIVEVDDAAQEEEAGLAERLSAFKVSLEGLVGPRAPLNPAFRGRYMELLQDSPAAAMAHGDLRRLLERLPGGQSDRQLH